MTNQQPQPKVVPVIVQTIRMHHSLQTTSLGIFVTPQ